MQLSKARPSMLIAIAAASSRFVKALIVNWDPWSVLKLSGLPTVDPYSDNYFSRREGVIDSEQSTRPCQYGSALLWCEQ